MKSQAENLVDLVNTAMPAIRNVWREKYNKGYQARMKGEPRMTHGKSKGFWFRGYDAADRELKETKE